jgi:hypothetical protein
MHTMNEQQKYNVYKHIVYILLSFYKSNIVIWIGSDLNTGDQQKKAFSVLALHIFQRSNLNIWDEPISLGYWYVYRLLL